MKKIALITTLAAASLGFNSCCSMFGTTSQSLGYRTETRQVKACGYDTVTEQIVTPSSSKGGMPTVEVVEKKIQRYKTVSKNGRVPAGPCVRFYCPKKDACGTTSDSTLKMSSAQGSVGSPNIGLVPTMKQIAP